VVANQTADPARDRFGDLLVVRITKRVPMTERHGGRLEVNRERLHVDVAQLDGFVHVQLRGELDYDANVEHRDTLRRLTGLRGHVVVDLSGVDFMDSGGLRFLLRTANRHEPVTLTNVPPTVLSVLRLTGVDQVFDMDTSGSARKAL
jgi:anti-sigma B factor antagonist